MSMRLRPMDKEDLRYLYKGRILNPNNITAPEYEVMSNKFRISKAQAHVRGCIELKVPCINSVICGSKFGMVSKVLGMGGTIIEDLAYFTTCIQISAKDIVPVAGISGDSSDYLFNGQALLYLIDGLKASDSIANDIGYLVKTLVGKDCQVSVTQTKTDYPVIGNWYVDLTGTPRKGFSAERLRESVVANIGGKYSRACILINLLNSCGSDEGVREYLRKALILTAIPILPISMRPKLGNKEHPLTSAYVRLYSSNNDYSVYKDSSAEEYKEYYKEIFCLVDTITCINHHEKGDIVAKDKDLKKVRPLLDTIKGKTGRIRGLLLKKRQDYSGRSAVVVNPFMSVNSIGMPKSAIPKLYRRYIIKDCKVKAKDVLEKLHSADFDSDRVAELIKLGIIEDVPVLLGRNPTLHRHGIQGFHAVPVNGRAIEVSPLVCPAFNMDFDGDTGHTEVPLSAEAAREISRLIMTDQNVLLPKTGESTICPRMDIVYGLYMCTRSCYSVSTPAGTFANAKALKEAIYAQTVNVWDTVTISGIRTDIAGKLAFESCFPKTMILAMLPTPEINSKNIATYIARIQDNVTESFVNSINSLVELGFRVAYICSMSVSILTPLHSETEKAKDFDNAYTNFHERMKPINDLNDFGFYDPETYGIEYGNCLREVDKVQTDGIYDKIGDYSMFTHMAKSGARGNTSNLVQMFGSKGRVQKSDSELFNVTLEHSLQEQLTPTEHVISAYGARRGQIAKSIKTADTGYLTRKLAHAAASLVITCDDCGTHDGIVISREEIATYFYKDNMTVEDKEKASEDAIEVMVRFITGRYQAENGVKITSKEAYVLASSKPDAKVKIRSPLKCKNPCCQKCYGNDTSTGRTAAKGLAVGIIAAQSMGEPSTQMTMNEFHKGGTAGAASSPFDRLNSVLCQSDIRTESREGRYNAYNPIAWAPGKLVMEETQGTNVLLRIEPVNAEDASKYNYKTDRTVPVNNAYKIGSTVAYGESLRVGSGDYYIPEVTQFLGIERAQTTLVLMLYFLFKTQVNLVPIHLEIMATAMTGFLAVTSDRPRVKIGKYYTAGQLVTLKENYRNTYFSPAIRGVSSVITNNVNFMEALIMEDQRKVISDAVLNNLFDMGDSPLVQLALGQHVKVGTGYNSEFMEDRR